MSKSKDSIKIILRSTASPHFYTKEKNKRNKDKLVFKKYDPTNGVRRHVEYKEEKMK